ncbi:MAG TPA: hypothetical protein VHO69_19090 [Phototrophicaceae bacterium]|nr:hypothetical protein [Phototrophicaceae bacterium]
MRLKPVVVLLLVMVAVLVVFLICIWTLRLFPAVSEATAEVTAKAAYFVVEPKAIKRGGEVTLRWSVSGVEQVVISQYYVYPVITQTGSDIVYEDLPSTGELKVRLDPSQLTESVPEKPYVYSVVFILARQVPLPDGDTRLLQLASNSIKVRCPYERFFFGMDEQRDYCPLAPETQETMVYQPFERGFMVWRKETDTLYIFSTIGGVTSGGAKALSPLECTDQGQKVYACAPVDKVNNRSGCSQLMRIDLDQPPPDGLYAPVAVMDAPLRYDWLAQNFGWATRPEMEYTAIVQETYDGTPTGDVVYMTLPDCRVIVYAKGDDTWYLVQDQGCVPE